MGHEPMKTPGDPDPDVRADKRRRYPRAEVVWKITLESASQSQWQGETVDLNQFGMKVRLGTNGSGPPPGSVVRLRFSPPDGKSPMSLKGIVWRIDAGDPVVILSNLTTDDFLRLKQLTDSLLGG